MVLDVESAFLESGVRGSSGADGQLHHKPIPGHPGPNTNQWSHTQPGLLVLAVTPCSGVGGRLWGSPALP